MPQYEILLKLYVEAVKWHSLVISEKILTISTKLVYRQLKPFKGIFQELSLNGTNLYMRLSSLAVSCFRKMLCQEEKWGLTGSGTLFGNSTLALKRAIGVKSNANYIEAFTVENFNYGESTSYLDRALLRVDGGCISGTAHIRVSSGWSKLCRVMT